MTQVQSVALFNHASAGAASDAERDRTMVDALIVGLAGDEEESEEAISHGLQFGVRAFERGISLHHTMKALDLLLAMTLYAAETSLSDSSIASGSAAHGVRLARQLQRRAALLSLAAARGYTQAYSGALRERFRHLRHDLRNPLGTIKSVLSLMDDETVPAEARTSPNFRAIARRNARTLEDLIADRLGDAAALLPASTQEVSLRSIACGVRRELRREAERHGVTVVVGPSTIQGRVDAPGLELLLHGALQAALQECQPGDELHLTFQESVSEHATVILSNASGQSPIRDLETLERLMASARQIGAQLTAHTDVMVSVPCQPLDLTPSGASERPVPRDAAVLDEAVLDGESRHDVRAARQGHHRETGAH